MRTSAPSAAELSDHTGRLRPVAEIPLTFEATRLGLAFHEAGHAVLAMAYGMHVESTEVITWTIREGVGGVTGRTRYQNAGTSPWRFAAYCAAGEVAHVRYLYAYGLWTPEREAACAADHDREFAIDTLARFGFRLGADLAPQGGKSWASVRAVAGRMVRLLWCEIDAVAHGIDAGTRLTGDQAAALAGMVNRPAAGGEQS